MRLADFSSPSDALVATLSGPAFVPDPLPPKIDVAAVALPLLSATQALGELKGASRRVQNPAVLVRPLQHQEALTSSAMEGTFTTADNLLLAEAGIEKEGDQSTREVVNYLQALNESFSLLRHLPISHRVIRRAHEILLSGLSPIRGASKRPGEYKNEQNWIGGATPDKARYVPPPPSQAQTCMDQLETYINRPEPAFPTPLMDLALVHYQLEAIHPFADGNGRVGRMLIAVMTVQSGLLDIPILYMSPVLERQKDRYIDLMYNVSAKGEWAAWLSFFFECVTESCRETIGAVDRLIDLQIAYRKLAAEAGRTATAIALVDLLFERPAMTVTDAKDRLGVSYPSAKSAIDKLVNLGIMASFENTYPKVFYAPAIMRASRFRENEAEVVGRP